MEILSTTVAPATVHEEHSQVRLVDGVETEYGTLPAGSAGTVVGIYEDKVGYEVEFSEPFHAVITLRSTDIQR